MLNRFNLKDKVIVLTGGAGLYGRGLSADLAAANANLVIASRDLDACQKVADHESEQGHSVTAMCYDQGDESSIQSLCDQVIESFGRVDGLVNNSVARTMGKGGDQTQAWQESMRINATGIYLMHRIFGQALSDGGSIVNIGSMQGMIGPCLSLYKDTDMGTGSPDYFFHKGGMINLTRYYASHLGHRGIRVNCLSPGGFFNNQPKLFLERYEEKTFLHRMGNKTDLGGSVVFLLSDASAYITGTNLPVDGGYTAQ